MQSDQQDAQHDRGHQRPEGLVQLAQDARQQDRKDQEHGAEVPSARPLTAEFLPRLLQDKSLSQSRSSEICVSFQSLWPFWRKASVSRARNSSVALRLMSWPIWAVCCASACDLPSSFCPTGR